MKAISLHSQIISLAKQAGVMLCGWSGFNNSLSYDRTPEIKLGFQEGSGVA